LANPAWYPSPPLLRLTSRKPLWLDLQPVDIKSRRRHNWKSVQVVNSHLVCDPTIRQPGFDLPRRSGLCWTVCARNRDTAVPEEGNGDLQTLICVLVAGPRRWPTLLNLVPWQDWMAACLGCILRVKTLFRGWPVMVNDTHTRRRRMPIRISHFAEYPCLLVRCQTVRSVDSETTGGLSANSKLAKFHKTIDYQLPTYRIKIPKIQTWKTLQCSDQIFSRGSNLCMKKNIFSLNAKCYIAGEKISRLHKCSNNR